ncbi:MAG: hypothetical protein MJ154_00285 [Candidatus Saccharibacteria bacterium]|nr:hypothetical protein [Candidatus Saccharibacteria bacterium]
MEEVKVRVSKASGAKNASAVNKRRLQSSTTLNRRFVKKPTPVPRIKASAGAASRTLKAQGQRRALMAKGQVRLQPVEAQQQQATEITQQTEKVIQQATKQLGEQKVQSKIASRAASSTVSLRDLASVRVKDVETIDPAQESRVARVAKARMAARKAEAPKALTAQELKDRAIQQALRKVSTMEEEATASHKTKQRFWQRKGFALAASMAVISLAILGYLVSVNLPDISVRVAAMHSGIEKAYPSYVPANYRLDGLVQENNGRITMAFKNDRDQKFTLMEEKSSWDSSAVLSNYVAKNWGASYSIAKGQGLTIYVSGSNAAWVNGGVFYVIIDDTNSLSASDLHDIAVSL